MRSPAEMGNIQIDITNACVHACANCTRFCGHHRKTFFMSFDAFKRAVDSLDEWGGCVGVIGGEPTLHPEFERFADYLNEKRYGGKKRGYSRKPISDLNRHIWAELLNWSEPRRSGLWSSISASYYKHFETINDTFKVQLLNDHYNKSIHQALLMNHEDLGITGEEWIKKRDACWIQNTWSAAITPKGAFFCEVAGALDMLFDGDGGWEVEPGWWKRTPDQFGDQLKWCEMCSGCLDVPKRLSNDERDDITPTNLKRLEQLGSPRIKAGKFVLHETVDFDPEQNKTFTGGNEYMEAAEEIRAAKDNRILHPRDVKFLPRINWQQTLAKMNDVTDWIAVCDSSEESVIRSILHDYILNPGCLYIINNRIMLFNVLARALRDRIKYPKTLNANLAMYYEPSKIIKLMTRN